MSRPACPPLPGAGSLVRVTSEPLARSSYAEQAKHLHVPLSGRVVRVVEVLPGGALHCAVVGEPTHQGAIRPEWVAEVLELVPHEEPARGIMLRVVAPDRADLAAPPRRST